MDPLYILTRTSGRPRFFERCRESIKALTYPDITHVVHTDDPRCESYIEADILIRGEAHGPNIGTAPYNLYMRRLIEAVPENAWIHFIDDDDEYTDPDVFEKILGERPNPSKLHVCKVSRWNDTIWPRNWKTQKSFQTECFVIRGKHARTHRRGWWGDKGGDHHFTKQVTRAVSMEWHDVLAVRAQEGKGHGALIDADGEIMDYDTIAHDTVVWFKGFVQINGTPAGKVQSMTFAEAREYERDGKGRVTYKGVEQCIL